MRPVKLTIYGDFVDCQIYRGRLYLWTFDGDLKVYDWHRLIEFVQRTPFERLALKFSFLEGDYLYRDDISDMFTDSEFRRILLKKFELVSQSKYELASKEADSFLYGQQSIPRNIIPTDSEIYGNKLFFVTDDGLYVSTAHRSDKRYPVSSRPRKLCDHGILSIKANSYPQLALSCGGDGLFELNISDNARVKKNEPSLISKGHSTFANYTHISIYNSSSIDHSYMALFKWREKKSKRKKTNEKPEFERKYDSIINDNQIFHATGERMLLSWGVEDKIYRAKPRGFEIVRFNNYAKSEEGEKFFEPIRSIDLDAWKGQVIDGGTAFFGTIVECENALVVLLSDGSNYTISGPITRWRVYPRSHNYENHLHVIKDDRIEIYSFNQDYFMNQEEKVLGIRYKSIYRSRYNSYR